MTDNERIFVAKKQGFRLVKHLIPDKPKEAIWELIAPDQTELKRSGISAMVDETEADIWEHLFTQYRWLGQRNIAHVPDAFIYGDNT